MRWRTVVMVLLCFVAGTAFANGPQKKSNPVCETLTNLGRSDHFFSSCEDITTYIERQTKIFGSDDPSVWKIPTDVVRGHLYEVFCRPPKDDCPHMLEALVNEVVVTPTASDIAEACRSFALDTKNDPARRRFCVRLALAGDPGNREWLLNLLSPEQHDWGWLLREVYAGLEGTSLVRKAIAPSVLIASIGTDTHAREVAGTFYLDHREIIDSKIREALFFVAAQGCSHWSIDKLKSSDPDAIPEIDNMCGHLKQTDGMQELTKKKD